MTALACSHNYVTVSIDRCCLIGKCTDDGRVFRNKDLKASRHFGAFVENSVGEDLIKLHLI